MKGYMSFVLHAHLPFIKHPEYDEFLEEDWYFEAAVETYLPLLGMMEHLRQDNVPFALNLVITPSLAAMMEDPHHKARLLRYLDKSLSLAEAEVRRNRDDPAFGPVSRFYLQRLGVLRDRYANRYHQDLIGAFRQAQDQGGLEIMTCAATHGFLPLLRQHPQSVYAQIDVGVREYERHFGRPPRGIWLPESAYFEGVENVLADHDIRYFIVDTHALRLATPAAVYDCYAPVFTPAGPAAFARDPESSKQVWSAKEGYPGDQWYRDFYRDIGFDRPFDYIRPYIQPTGLRKPTGLKYHRVTGDVPLDQKAPYDRGMAMQRAVEHAGNFVFNRTKQVEYLASSMGRKPLVVAPYDAELFGHWWFEGPDFLEQVFRKAASDQQVFEFITLSNYLRANDVQQQAVPAESSWGDKGYFDVWLNGENDYMIRHVLAMGRLMTRMANQWPDAQGLQRRALDQAARELLLAQSSDWPFLITTGTAKDYAKTRFKRHVIRFLKLASQLRSGTLDEGFIAFLEHRDSLFPDIDYMVFK